MKKIIFLTLLVSVFFSAQTHAGIFEYYLGEKTSTNAPASSADTVEAIKKHPNAVDERPSYRYPSSSRYNDVYYAHTPLDPRYNDYHNSQVYYRDCKYKNSVRYKKDCKYYIGYDNGRVDFYRKKDLVNILEKELDFVEDEIKRVSDIISDIKDDIRDAKRYATSYYRDVRRALERDLDYFEERKDDLKDREDDLEDELRKVKRSKSSSKVYYYDKYGLQSYKVYDRNDYYDRYYRNDEIKNDTRYGYYTEYYNFVNPNLKPVKEGRIYIR